jgi:putative redox protein
MACVTAPAPSPLTLRLDWDGDLRFTGRADGVALVLDADKKAGPSPVQALAAALAGCMATDVVDILRKGRLPLRGLEARLTAHRPTEPPQRLLAVALHFAVTGDVPPDRVERAIALSRERYCSVWHSLRQDIDFTTTFEIRPAGP